MQTKQIYYILNTYLYNLISLITIIIYISVNNKWNLLVLIIETSTILFKIYIIYFIRNQKSVQ